MKLDLTYRQIWRISAPIMLGSAAQNVIVLSDGVLLYHYGRTEFAAIGFVGVFYLVMAAIGYSFSRAGQIMIARRMGEGRHEAVGHVFHTMFIFEFVLALIMWAFMHYGSAWFFAFFLENSPDLYQKCLEYIHFRSFGIFFSYCGIALISLYSGIARTTFILIDTLVLGAVNLILNYALIFGEFGLPRMGIAGSGLASSIAEGVAFVVFAVYMIFDRKNRPLKIFTLPRPDWPMTKQQLYLALPVVAQAILGQGSWVFFFGMVENLGEKALAVSNLVRMVYLVLSIPMWGFSSGVNTLTSNLIGQGRHGEVFGASFKTGWFAWLVTLAPAILLLGFPQISLPFLMGKTEIDLIPDARPIFYILSVIMTLAVFGAVLFNGLCGTGATMFGLKMQFAAVGVYIFYLYYITHYTTLGLPFVWMSEIVYWLVMITLTWLYLRTERWHAVEV